LVVADADEWANYPFRCAVFPFKGEAGMEWNDGGRAG